MNVWDAICLRTGLELSELVINVHVDESPWSQQENIGEIDVFDAEEGLNEWNSCVTSSDYNNSIIVVIFVDTEHFLGDQTQCELGFFFIEWITVFVLARDRIPWFFNLKLLADFFKKWVKLTYSRSFSRSHFLSSKCGNFLLLTLIMSLNTSGKIVFLLVSKNRLFLFVNLRISLSMNLLALWNRGLTIECSNLEWSVKLYWSRSMWYWIQKWDL